MPTLHFSITHFNALDLLNVREGAMLKLDRFSESVLFQCERCRFVGQLFTEVVEEEGSFHCWNCLNEINHEDRRRVTTMKSAACS